MFILANELGVQTTEFDARVGGRELPVDAGSAMVAIAFPSGSVGNSWPASGYFPVGTSLVTFSATDAAGNMTAESMTIAVANNQLLDADLTFIGVFNTASTRPIRFTVGGVSTVKQVAFAGTAGTARGRREVGVRPPALPSTGGLRGVLVWLERGLQL